MSDNSLPGKFYNRKKCIDSITDELLILGSEIIKILYKLETIINSSKLVMKGFLDDPIYKKLISLREEWVKIVSAQDEEK